jgi:two-component system sensor histidine kinase KdpD
MASALPRMWICAPTIGMPALMVAAATSLLLALNPVLPPNLIWLGYLVPVVLASVRWGLLGAAAASIVAGLAGDFFFTQPYYSFWMDDPHDVLALILFLLAAFGSAAVITKGRLASHGGTKPIPAFYQLLLDLSECETTHDVVARFDQWISVAGKGRAIVIRAQPVDTQVAIAPDEIHRIAIEMCAAKTDRVRTITTATNKHWFLKQLRSEHTIHGTLVVETGSDANDRRLFEAAITGAATRFSDLARRETLTATAGYLLDAEFSQRWGTPLTTILGAAGVLQMRAQADETNRVERTLLADIRDEAVQLGRLLRNTFSALRATVHGTRSCLNWTDPVDLLTSTLDESGQCGAAVEIKTSIGKDMPLIEIDSTLFAQGCGQLLCDELRSSPPKSTIEVDVHRAGNDLTISISREPSPGAANEDGERLMRRQARLHSPSYSSEIGMWIASSLVRAAGATINPAPQHSPYGPIARLRIPLRRANEQGLPEMTRERSGLGDANTKFGVRHASDNL